MYRRWTGETLDVQTVDWRDPGCTDGRLERPLMYIQNDKKASWRRVGGNPWASSLASTKTMGFLLVPK